MKSLLAIAAALALSATGALAECAYHTKTTASVEVDDTMTTASIVKETPSKADLALKTDKTDEQGPEAVSTSE